MRALVLLLALVLAACTVTIDQTGRPTREDCPTGGAR
jgi:hypothetical protein